MLGNEKDDKEPDEFIAWQLQHYFHEVQPAETQQWNEEKLVWELSKAIKILLAQDFNRLLNLLYRMDVSEAKVKHIIHERAPDTIHIELAKLMVEREKQKQYFRKKYASKPKGKP